MKKDREYRDMAVNLAIEVRAETEPEEIENPDVEETPEEQEEQKEQEDRKIVRGYASTFDEPYTLYEDDELRFDEIVDKNAFANTDMSDVIMQYNHEGRVFARTSNETLKVTTDERGLLIEADLGGTELGRQLYEEIAGGYTNRMSFGFIVDGEKRDNEETEDGKVRIQRRITSVQKLYDVSAVSIPANDATTISVRNLADGVIEEIQAERLEAEKLELRRRKLLMRLKLEVKI